MQNQIFDLNETGKSVIVVDKNKSIYIYSDICRPILSDIVFARWGFPPVLYKDKRRNRQLIHVSLLP